MKNIYYNKDILVTGGCGSIGSEIVKQLLKYNPDKIRVFDNNESGHFYLNQKIKSPKIRNLVGDIRDKDRVLRALDGVDIVFHAAALKHVPFCEYNPFEAVYTNVIGTKNIAEGAIQKDARFVVGISTDKAVNPVNTMGATKLLAEKLLINAPTGQARTRLSCVRFGNVLDSVGSVIPIFREQIARGGPVTITSKDMTRFFMTIPQAVNMILDIPNVMKGSEVFILKMNALKITDLAEVMIEELAPRYGRNPKNIKIMIIGVRPGEKMHESLFSEEESAYISENGRLFVLKNSILDTPNFSSKLNHLAYNSGNVNLLSKKEIRELLYKNSII